MNNLKVKNINGVLVVEIREVALMVAKRHDHLLRDIQGYISILSDNPTLGSENFFVESTFENKGKHYTCYLLTRKGCDIVANKMTGEKCVLFSATYINRFYEMEQQLR
ncbi:Rha family transcriptional regulator [Clostridium magnum]|uniref:Phage regulatory protein Rha n=1 Tax=Clostridium magnum DSM 2767 TaxID=1121326 RepID=A0A161X8Z8_9CLOT|nr:Rha family transcriptional regulator [Clostridium magnum]KZL90686.1 phage regulatory protein Rha [Clostridium magnum DSM 2767]SHI40164.1 phage regulatory protein, rha family [Clostridium magnum DSM 2767]